MAELFRNSSPGALTFEQAVALEKKRLEERRRRKRQAEELAAQGRGGDTEIAHVTLGEIVLPDALQTPAVLDAIRQAALDANIPLEQLRVGSALNSINPQTGQPEFFGPSDFYCDRGSQGESCEGWVPGFYKDKSYLHMPTPEELAQLPDAQKEFYARFYEGTGDGANVLGTGLLGAARLYNGARRLGLRVLGKTADESAPTLESIAKAYRGSMSNSKPRF